MKYAILDVETTIFQKGNPYAERNKLCVVGLRVQNEDGASKNYTFLIEWDSAPYSDQLKRIADLLAGCPLVVGFNLKFDLAWLARYGIYLSHATRVFDCQLAEFILSHQTVPFPSLDGCLSKYSLGSKSVVVERDYWSLGIDTPQIPLEVLIPYLETDLEKTDELYSVLKALLDDGSESRRALTSLHMQDLRVLFEMERNGLMFHWVGLEQAALRAEEELKEIDAIILNTVPLEFRSCFNGASGDHLSAFLYGGTITVPVGTPYEHTFKTGKSVGTTLVRYRWHDQTQVFPQRITPPEGSGLKKDGFYSVDEETLHRARFTKDEAGQAAKHLVKALLRRSKLEKLCGTYLRGIRKHVEKYDWQDQLIHGTFNQCRVVTGRLSSEKPNQQNFPDEMMQFIVSRFADTC